MVSRVVSLIASSTETVCALGAAHLLVGRSHECDYPPQVRALPCCSRARVDGDNESGQIDRDVRTLISQALSLYHIDPDVLHALRPDLIITQDHCRVCAVSLDDVNRALCELLNVSSVERPPLVLSLHPATLVDVLNDIERIAFAIGYAEAGKALVTQLRSELKALRTRHHQALPPTVLCLEWLDPLLSSGSWLPALVECAGARCAHGQEGASPPRLDDLEIAALDPDVIVITPCGFDLARTRAEVHRLALPERWSEIRAVREGRLFIADGNRFFNRPGPGVLRSAQLLAEMIDGEVPGVVGEWERVG